ncbi:MAG: hypothetical protein WA814_04955 [Candidatus Baltobacteraceae bacterium]
MTKIRSFLLACALGATTAGAALPAAAQVYGGAYVQFGPPAPIAETVPAPPGSGYYWTPGYWRWNGRRYVWVGGRYAYPPYGGAVWHPGHWVSGPYGWYWREGHWSR